MLISKYNNMIMQNYIRLKNCFKDNDQFPIFGMNSTSSAVTSTATNFTPSSVDSLMTLYKPQHQKQTWGCELCEEQPLQNVADCCDSDGEDSIYSLDSIDAFFKDFGPLNGNSSKTLCLFTTDQARKFVVKMYSMHDDDLLPFSPFTVDIKNVLKIFF